MGVLNIRVLGTFAVESDGRPIAADAWRRNRARSLVKILAIAPAQRLHREQLMEALWPDLEPEAAAANLRKALHFARAAIGREHLATQGEIIALAGDAVWVDAAAFETSVRAGRNEDALELHRGDLLPDDRFEPWADEPRDRLRARFHRALRDRAAEFEAEADLVAAADALERLLESDPLNEEAHLALMRIRARAGERHLALQQYRRLQDVLRDELGVEPNEAAQRFIKQLGAGGAEAPDQPVAGPSSRRPRASAASGGEAPTAAIVPEELKLVTVVAADDRVDTPDLEAARQELQAWTARSIDLLRAAGASADSASPGAVVGVFGVPAVHEDDAANALRAALQLVSGSQLVRVGVATASVIAPMGRPAGAGELSGPGVMEAGQLRERAAPGTALVGVRTVGIAGASFRFDPPPAPAADGEASEEIPAQRIVAEIALGVGVEGAQADAPIVGRTTELAAVLEGVARALGDGGPRAVLLVGNAGVGKSRLVREIATLLAGRPDRPAILLGRCQPGGRAGPYGALGDILRAACGITLAESAAAMEGRLRRRIDALLPEASPEERASMAYALGTSAGITLRGNPLDDVAPGDVVARLGVAWPRFASALARQAPTMLLFEDLHWAAGELLDMIEHIVRRASGPLIVLATARPDLRSSRPDFGADERFAVINLGPLATGESIELMQRLVEDGSLEPVVRAGLLARAEGNPLYLEQLALHVRSAGAGAIPDTLLTLLAARLDTLPVADRRLLQEAAVMGRTFWAAPLRAALGDERVEARLAALERGGFLARRPASSLPGQVEFSFRHALLHDVAYASLPRARRARAHAAAGAWLEALAGDRASEVADLLAHHFWSAIPPATDLAWADGAEREAVRTRAFDHLLRAGVAARRHLATDRATELHERALTIAADRGERRRALEALGEDAEADFHGDAAADFYRTALELARSAGGPDDVARLARRLAWLMASMPGAFRASPDPAAAEALVAEGLATEPTNVERAWLLIASGEIRRLFRGSEPFGRGRDVDPKPIAERIAAAEEGGRIGATLGRGDIVRAARQALGVLYGIAGRYREMLELAERDVADIRPGDSRLEQADAIRKLGTVRIAIDAAFDEGLELGRRAQAFGGDGPPHQVMHALSPILVALFQLGRWDELLEALDEHMAAFRLDPATECQAVRDGPAIGATTLALLGRSGEARDLAALLGDPLVDPSASAWQARYATAAGQPGTARVIAGQRALEGSTYGPQHAFALLEALSALGDLAAAAAALPDARRSVAGNALLGPLADRVEGEVRLASGDGGAAVELFRSAAAEFGRLKAVLEEARALDHLAAALAGAEAAAVLADAAAMYARLGLAPPAGGPPSVRAPA